LQNILKRKWLTPMTDKLNYGGLDSDDF